MKKLLLAALLALALVAVGVTVAAARGGNGNGGKHLSGKLDGFQEVPSISTSAEGKIKLKLNGSSIRYKLQYRGFAAGNDVLFAHIHLGQRATNGGVAAFLCGGGGKPACPQSGTVTGTVTASDVIGPTDQGIAAGELDELIRAMKSGVTYANVHSDKFPGGEIRGQIGDDDDDDNHGRGDDHDDD